MTKSAGKSGKNWTKAELKAKGIKQDKVTKKLAKANKVADILGPAALNKKEREVDPYQGLTTRQKTIARLKTRGLSQQAIGDFLEVTQPVISKELKRIRTHYAAKGKHVNQDTMVGESLSVYEEVEHKAWEIYHTGEGEQTKALSLILTAREKQTKLLMDLGKLRKVGTTHTHSVTVSPLVQSWSSGEAHEAVNVIISSQLSELEAPEPPELGTGDIIDVEISELEEPELDEGFVEK